MACINDKDVGECFTNMLEDIRTKLISQVVGEMVETEADLHHTHRQSVKAGLGTCPLTTCCIAFYLLHLLQRQCLANIYTQSHRLINVNGKKKRA